MGRFNPVGNRKLRGKLDVFPGGRIGVLVQPIELQRTNQLPMASDPMRVLLHRLARPPHPFLFRSLWTTCSLKYLIEIRSGGRTRTGGATTTRVSGTARRTPCDLAIHDDVVHSIAGSSTRFLYLYSPGIHREFADRELEVTVPKSGEHWMSSRPSVQSCGAVYASAVAAEMNTTRLLIRTTSRRSRGRSLPECMPGRPRKPASMLRGGRRNARRAPPEG